jgi:excisionase family DNA binding protein
MTLAPRSYAPDPHAVKRASVPRLALTAMEAAASLGVSHDFFREHIAPELRWARRGRKKLVSVRELERWLEAESARLFAEG